jgi:hypothetical protein
MMSDVPALVNPHGTFLTREKTEAAPDGRLGAYKLPPGLVLGKKPKKDPLVRKAYLQLDLLKPGDVFVSRTVITKSNNKT